MNNILRTIASVFALLLVHHSASGQFRYFIKLFETNDKKYIQVIEENQVTRQREAVQNIQDDGAYERYSKKLNSSNTTEIMLPGIYNTRRAFPSEDPMKAIEEDLKIQVQKSLSIDKDGKVENVTVSNTFRSNRTWEATSLSTVDKLKVFISIPSDETEFKNIFGSLDQNQLKDARQLRQSLAAQSNKNITLFKDEKVFSAELAKPGLSTPIVVIGHNENGIFHLPDGTGITIGKLDSTASNTRRIIIFLSCKSRDYTTSPASDAYLTYNDAIAITNRINRLTIPMTNGEECKNAINAVIDGYTKETNKLHRYKMAGGIIFVSGLGYTIFQIRQVKEINTKK